MNGHNTWFALLYSTLVTQVWFHSTTAIISEAGSRLAGPFVHFEWMGNRQKVPQTFKLELDGSDRSAPCRSHFPVVRTNEDDGWALRGGLGHRKISCPYLLLY